MIQTDQTMIVGLYPHDIPWKKTFSWIFPWFFPWNHELLPKSLQPRLRWPQSGASEVASAASCAVKCHWGGSPTGRSGKVGSLAQDVLEIGDIGRLYFRLLELKKMILRNAETWGRTWDLLEKELDISSKISSECVQFSAGLIRMIFFRKPMVPAMVFHWYHHWCFFQALVWKHPIINNYKSFPIPSK
jgi:hypothetical protein